LLKRHFLLGCALLMAAGGCMAQQGDSGTGAAKPTATDPAPATATAPMLNRKIEVMIRSELSVPPQYEVSIGARQKSEMTGYDTIPVTFSLPGRADHSQTVEFLLSKDGSTLARLSKWDLGPEPGSELPTIGRPVRGAAQAKVTIVNFDDLECPYCARMHSVFFPETLERYKGLVKFVYLDYPLVEIHPWALHAAVDANCLAGESDTAYWNYVDYLHTHGEDVSGPDNNPGKSAAMLDKLAEQQGALEHVDAAKLTACVTKQDGAKVEAEMKSGDKVGVNATPTFFVNGERWAGQLDEAQLWVMIDRALKAQGIAPPAPAAPVAAPAAGSPSAH
jgi:protein-disulfide isomerase